MCTCDCTPLTAWPGTPLDDCFYEENGLGWYLKNNIGPFLIAVRISRTIPRNGTVDPKEFKKTKEEQRKMNGLQKECMDNLLEIWRTRIRTTHGDG